MSVIMEALKRAEEKRKGNGGNGSSLPDLSQIKVQEKTPEQVAVEIEKAKKKDEWCRNAAPLLLKIRQRISEIRLVEQHGPLSDELSAEMADYKKKEETLLKAGGDSALVRHLDFSVLLEQIRTAPQTPENATFFLEEVMKHGRYTLLSKEEAEAKKREWRQAGSKIPEGIQFFSGKVYVPFQPAEGETRSKGQMALESVLGQYLNAVRKIKTTQIKAEIEKIKAKGGLDIPLFKQGKLGRYALYFSKRTDESGRQWHEGAGLISLEKERKKDGFEITVILVLDGAGSLRWLRDFKNRWVPFGWYKNGIPDHIDGELGEFAEKLLKTIRAAMAAHYAQK